MFVSVILFSGVCVCMCHFDFLSVCFQFSVSSFVCVSIWEWKCVFVKGAVGM